MPVVEVNVKKSIKKPHYYHCFKISDSEYTLFDVKMDMPMIVGSIAIVKSLKLPENSVVFYYHAPVIAFEKPPMKTIEIKGDGKYMKPPMRFKKLEKGGFKIFHHFRLSSVLSAFFDEDMDMPVIYGDNQKVQATVTKLDKTNTIVYYKEDGALKNSFKMWMIYEGKKS